MKMFLKMLVCAVVLGTINCQASDNNINIINQVQNNVSLQGNMNQLITDNNFTWEQMKKCASFPAIDLDSEVYKKFCNFCAAYDISYIKKLVTEFLTQIYNLAHEIMYSTSIFEDKQGAETITLPNVIKHWNLQKQFDLNPNLIQNQENQCLYSNTTLQARNK